MNHCGNFLGLNGVLVDTYVAVISTHTGRIGLKYTDKNTFKLTAQCHGFGADGILCEKSNSL